MGKALDEAGVVGAQLGPGLPFSPQSLLGRGSEDEAAAVVTAAYDFATDAATQDAVPVLESLFTGGKSLQVYASQDTAIGLQSGHSQKSVVRDSAET